MKKISILGLHLGYGGVEQAIVNLANMLVENYEVELAITYPLLEEIPYKMDQRVKIKYLTNVKPNKEEIKKYIQEKKIISLLKELKKSISILHQRKKTMKQYIQNSESDIIISSRILFTELLNRYAKKGVITIAQEHRHHNQDQKYIKKIKKSCTHIDYLMPVSEELTNFYRSILTGKTKCIYIPNALEHWTEKVSSLQEKNIISVGRLSKEKGFLDLIDVFSKINYKDWKLHIIGDGQERKKIEEKIQEKHLTDSVFLHGFQKKDYIYEQLLHSSIFVLCSYEESFGIVLIEAASFGIPLLAFSSARGAHEIINEKNGILIENRNKDAMAKQIEMWIESYEIRKKLGEEARKSVEKYSFENVKHQWICFLSSLEEKK